jgi:hypothetical protein
MIYTTILKPEGTVIKLSEQDYEVTFNVIALQGMVTGTFKYYVFVENTKGISKVLETNHAQDGSFAPIIYDDPLFGPISIIIDLACELVQLKF